MPLTLGLGYSSCPNDTFMFHGLVHGRVPVQDLGFSVYMDDIEALNRRALGETDAAPLAITKVSAGALPWLTRDYAVMRAGAALGRGCGPLVVAQDSAGLQSLKDLRGKRVAIPGERTTANLLLRIFAPDDLHTEALRFEQIMPAVEKGEFDAGLIIHESRFTFQDHGLKALCDLGDVWEEDTGLPLPLGVIAARRELGADVIGRIEGGLSNSVRHAYAHPDESREYIREHAQEMSADVCKQHIELYVNDYSVDIGDEGTRAIDTLLERGASAGVLPADAPSPWLGQGRVR